MMMVISHLMSKHDLKNIGPLPEYTLEGISPTNVSYFKWDRNSLEWIEASKEDAEYSGYRISTLEEFVLDRNGDGRDDLIVMKSFVPAISYENKEGEMLYEPKRRTLALKIDDDLDGYWDRLVIDDEDEEGNPGMDGKFDRKHRL